VDLAAPCFFDPTTTALMEAAPKHGMHDVHPRLFARGDPRDERADALVAVGHRLEPDLHEAANQRGGGPPVEPHCRGSVDGPTVESLHADDPGAAVLPVDLGCRDHRVVPERGDVASHRRLVVRLERAVEFGGGRRVQVAHHTAGIGDPHPGQPSFGDRGHQVGQPQIDQHPLADPRPLDFHHGFAPVWQPAPVHLGDRTGRQWCVVELGEQCVHRVAEIGFEDCTHVGRGDRGDVVEQAQAGLRERTREHLRRGRHQLAEFHERGSEPLESVRYCDRDRILPTFAMCSQQPSQRGRSGGREHHHSDGRPAAQLAQTDDVECLRVDLEIRLARAPGVGTDRPDRVA